ncbi:hypothetical protein SGPA1_60211 [Streptomyces misionensis JCM 4497]
MVGEPTDLRQHLGERGAARGRSAPPPAGWGEERGGAEDRRRRGDHGQPARRGRRPAGVRGEAGPRARPDRDRGQRLPAARVRPAALAARRGHRHRRGREPGLSGRPQRGPRPAAGVRGRRRRRGTGRRRPARRRRRAAAGARPVRRRSAPRHRRLPHRRRARRDPAAARAEDRQLRPDARRLRHRVPGRRPRAEHGHAGRDRGLAGRVLLRPRGDRPRLAGRRRRLEDPVLARTAAPAPQDLPGPARHLLPGQRPQPRLARAAQAANAADPGAPRGLDPAHPRPHPLRRRAQGLVRRFRGGPAQAGGRAPPDALADGVAAHAAGASAGDLTGAVAPVPARSGRRRRPRTGAGRGRRPRNGCRRRVLRDVSGPRKARRPGKTGRTPAVHLRRPGPCSSPDPACGDTPPSYATDARAVGPVPME